MIRTGSLLKSNSGVALMIGVMVMFMIAVMGISYLTLTSTNLMRANREAKRATAFYLAEAGVEYRTGRIALDPLHDGAVDSTSIMNSLRSGSTGSITVTLDSGSTTAGTIVSTATFSGQTETIRVRVRSKGIGVWDNAVFAGDGLAGHTIAGNVVIRGSLHILGAGDPFTDSNGNGKWDAAEPYVDKNNNGIYDAGDTFTDTDGNGVWSHAEPYQDNDLNGAYTPPIDSATMDTELTGTADIGNNYSGMPSGWEGTLIPTLETQDYNGEMVKTLNAEVRVKHGRLGLQGNAQVGWPNVTGGSLAVKETMDGMYVTDGYSGKGASSVYSDNGASQTYDLGDQVKFPSLLDPYVAANGTKYDTYEAFLVSKALVCVPAVTNIGNVSIPFFSDGFGNSLSWEPDTKTLTITGIIRFPGNLTISQDITYAGKGTLFVQGDVSINNNILPKTTFPTVDGLGIIAKGSITADVVHGQAMGAWYAQKQILLQKQMDFAGTIVSNYFSMTQVPSIYQVPALSTNLPPGMPGGDVRIVASKTLSWRHM